ncbi:DUF6337 family protein [Bacillus salipaludis]|uniref:DUF6337 family protein n=1 Tax=Bacillus salipaludis TaxID=2547811 RepID=A0ABW8RL30_9BACI
MAILCWLISVIQIVILILCERRIFKKKIMSPILFLGFPFLAITLLSICFGSIFNFVSLTKEIFIIWWIGIFFVWFGGVLSHFVIPKKNRIYSDFPISSRKTRRICIAITITGSISILMRAYQLFWGASVHIFASNDFSAALAQGVYGWIRIALLICLTYILCTFKIKETTLIEVIAVILGIATIMIYQIKGVTLLPLVVCVLYRYQSGKKVFSTKVILGSVFIAASVFFIAYALPYVLSGDYSVLTDSEFYKYIGEKIMKYCWAGILAFCKFININIEPSEPWYILISPIYNVLRRLWDGEGTSPVTSYFLEIGPDITSNVFTIFGTIYIFSSYLGLILISFIIGFFAYWSMELAIKNPNNEWYKLGYAMFLFYMVMGIFDYFFYHAYVLIMLVLVYFIGFKAKRSLRVEVN